MESVPESPRSRLHTLAHLESKTVSGLWHRVSCKKLLRRIFGLERELQKKELCESNTNTVKKRMSGMEMSQGGQAKIKVIGEASAIASNLEKLEKGKRLKDSKDSKGLNTPKEKSRFEKLPRELRDEVSAAQPSLFQKKEAEKVPLLRSTELCSSPKKVWPQTL